MIVAREWLATPPHGLRGLDPDYGFLKKPRPPEPHPIRLRVYMSELAVDSGSPRLVLESIDLRRRTLPHPHRRKINKLGAFVQLG